MARIRTIKPEFFTHYRLWEAEHESGLPLRLAFAGLWTCCDREGRFKWCPPELKIACLPYDDIDFSRVLHALTTRGFVVKYRVNDEDFGYIPSWSKHQVINNRERASDIPEPNKNNIVTRGPRVPDVCTAREPRVTQGREGKGTVYSEATASGAGAPIPLFLICATDWRRALFSDGLAYLARVLGKPPPRSLLGKWLKAAGDDAKRVFDLLAECEQRDIADPVAYVTAALRDGAKSPLSAAIDGIVEDLRA